MEIVEKFIRACAAKGRVAFTRHALERMLERQIEVGQAVRCLTDGKVIELQNHGSDVKVLFQEASDISPSFYVVACASVTEAVIISVCRFREEAWEEVQGLMRRRKRHER